ncbi:hypothetical protein BC332_07850 [Capsicum chinense]|nr:hypothetical protein BC332_07850 [Capsicum chinense]
MVVKIFGRMMVRMKCIIEENEAVNLRSNSSQDREDDTGMIMKIDVCECVKSPPEGMPLRRTLKYEEDVDGSNLILSAKHSLATSAQQLPLDVNQVRLNSLLHVSSETSRITVSLKQSFCSSTDASFIQEYFLVEEKVITDREFYVAEKPCWSFDWQYSCLLVIRSVFSVCCILANYFLEVASAIGREENYQNIEQIFWKSVRLLIAKLQSVDSGGSDLRWVEQFNLSCTVKGRVHEIKEFGVVVSFLKCDDVFGFISHYQLSGIPVETGSSIRTAVLDVSKIECLVDLSLKPAFVNKSKKETTNSQTQKVVSLPSYNYTLGYASRADYNTQNLPPKSFTNGESVIATVMALPSPSTSGRLLLQLKSISEAIETSNSKRLKGNLLIMSDRWFRQSPVECDKYTFGCETPDGILRECNKLKFVLCDILEGYGEIEPVKKFSYSTGQLVSGFVYKVDSEWAWLTISRDVKAQLYMLNCNKEKKLVRLISHPLLIDPERPACQEDGPTDHSSENMTFHIRKGSVLGGRISKILPGVGGLLVQIDPYLYGKVHFTELTDSGVTDPLSGYHEGQFVKCKVLGIAHSGKGTVHIDLSLRSISHKTQKQKLSALNDSVNTHELHEPECIYNLHWKFPVLVEKIEDLHPDMMVQLKCNVFHFLLLGICENVTPKGCFVMRSRKVDAKVLLSNLSDGYVENPEKEFPVRKLVMGKVVSMEPLSKVKRVEPYGLFITVDHTNLVGLCHVSEISENHVDTIDSRHKAGDRVTAKILKVDKERHRILLGMKKSYFNDATSTETDARPISDYTVNGDALSIGIESTPSPEKSSQGREDLDGESVDGKDLFLAEVESRASIPPLEVPLDDTENLDMGDVVNEDSGNKKLELPRKDYWKKIFPEMKMSLRN